WATTHVLSVGFAVAHADRLTTAAIPIIPTNFMLPSLACTRRVSTLFASISGTPTRSDDTDERRQDRPGPEDPGNQAARQAERVGNRRTAGVFARLGLRRLPGSDVDHSGAAA